MSRATPFRIVFEQDEHPRELLNPSDWRKAIASEELRPETEVTLYCHGEPPIVRRAGEVPELIELFRQAQADSTEPVQVTAAEPREALLSSVPAEPTPSSRIEPEVPEPSIDYQATSSYDPRARVVTAGGGKTRYKALDGRTFATAPEARRHSDTVNAQRNSAASMARADRARAEARKSTHNRPVNPKKDDKWFGWILLGILFLAWAMS